MEKYLYYNPKEEVSNPEDAVIDVDMAHTRVLCPRHCKQHCKL